MAVSKIQQHIYIWAPCPQGLEQLLLQYRIFFLYLTVFVIFISYSFTTL